MEINDSFEKLRRIRFSKRKKDGGVLNATYVVSTKGGDGDKQELPNENNLEETSKISEKKQAKVTTRGRKTSKNASATKNAPEDVGKLTNSETKKVSITRKRGGVSQESKTKITEQTSDLPREENSPQKRPRRRDVKGINDKGHTSQVPVVTKQENDEDLKGPVEKKKGMKINTTKQANDEDLKGPVEKKKGMKINTTKQANDEDLKEPVEKKIRTKVKTVAMECETLRTIKPFLGFEKSESSKVPAKTLPATKSRSTRVYIEHCSS